MLRIDIDKITFGGIEGCRLRRISYQVQKDESGYTPLITYYPGNFLKPSVIGLFYSVLYYLKIKVLKHLSIFKKITVNPITLTNPCVRIEYHNILLLLIKTIPKSIAISPVLITPLHP